MCVGGKQTELLSVAREEALLGTVLASLLNSVRQSPGSYWLEDLPVKHTGGPGRAMLVAKTMKQIYIS